MISRTMKEHYLNIIAISFLAVSLYFLAKWSYQVLLMYSGIANMGKSILKEPWQVVVIKGGIALSVAVVGWLVSSISQIYEKSFSTRFLSFLCFYLLFDVSILAIITYFMYHHFFEPVRGLIVHVPPAGLPYLAFGNLDKLAWTGYLMPLGMFLYKDAWLFYRYAGSERVKEAFKTWQWKGKVPYLLSALQNEDNYPAVRIGVDEFENPVTIYGKDRPLQTLVVGPPGTGKSSRLLLPIVRQDLNHMQQYINAFGQLYQQALNADDPQKKDKLFERIKTDLGCHLNGITIIDPAKDLCDEVYRLALLHGFPEEAIVYLDPTDSNTKSFNVMRGPREQVAETLTMVLEGMAEEQDDFFRQAQRTVLKNYIYLLKTAKGDNCTLEDLVAMYQDPRLVMDMVEMVEKTMPEDIDAIPDRIERGEWKIVKTFIDWFRSEGLGIEGHRGEVQFYPRNHKHAGKAVVKDLQTEFTRGTRNILSDIVTNPKLRRVLCDGDDIDLDLLLSVGGVFLVNTAKGELSELSKVFGKLVLMSLQNAIFRREGKERTRPMHSLIVDELPEYINLPFRELTSQGRKYKVALIGAVQSLSQFAIDYKEAFVHTLLNTMRHHIVFGGISPYDARLFIEVAGKERRIVTSSRESETPSRMEGAGRSESVAVSEVLENFIENSDLVYQQEGRVYARLTLKNIPRRPQIVYTDYVDYEMCDHWKDKLDDHALSLWLKYYRVKVSLRRNQDSASRVINAGLVAMEPVEMGPVAEVQSGTPQKTLGLPELAFEEIDDAPQITPPKHRRKRIQKDEPLDIQENQQITFDVISEDEFEEEKLRAFVDDIRSGIEEAE